MKKITYLIIVILFSSFIVDAQEEYQSVIITEIEIEGSKKTRRGTILRELDFEIGDSIKVSELSNRLGKNQTLLLNTGLFYTTVLNVKNWEEDYRVTIHIKVREAWYIYPIPIFELADRNFNVWWKQFNRSFKRVNYGLKGYYYNISGRRDVLKATIQLGYTQKYELEYVIPFVNKAKTIGLNTNFLFTRNKEVGYTTQENDVIFYRDDDKAMLRRFRYGAGMTYRPGLYQTHTIHSTYYHRIIADSIQHLNPEFFISENQKQQFFALGYTYTWDRRDIKAYPLNGFLIEGSLTKEGLGIFNDRNVLFTESSWAYFKSLGKNKKYNISAITKGRYHFLRSKPSYYNNKALGYEEDYIRGYEFYVLDGMDYAYLKTSIKYQIFSKTINWKKAMPLEAFRIMPFNIYLTVNSDFGYVNDPHYFENNPLANEWLIGGGVGIDFVLYVDKVIQLEYSINRLGEKGVYLHYNLFF